MILIFTVDSASEWWASAESDVTILFNNDNYDDQVGLKSTIYKFVYLMSCAQCCKMYVFSNKSSNLYINCK